MCFSKNNLVTYFILFRNETIGPSTWVPFVNNEIEEMRNTHQRIFFAIAIKSHLDMSLGAHIVFILDISLGHIVTIFLLSLLASN